MAKATCSQRPMFPLNNELKHIKIILHPAFKGDILWHFVCRHVERAKSHFGHVTSYELTHFKKMAQV